MAAAGHDPQARAKALRETILRSMSKDQLLEYALAIRFDEPLERRFDVSRGILYHGEDPVAHFR
jgi:hypothetical protein